MKAALVRGYCIAKASDFVHTHYNASTAERIEQSYSLELRSTLAELRREGWYPREHFIELTRAVASARNESAYDDLLSCGQFLGDQTENAFMQLAMKILTPELLVKKLPRLWQRDHGSAGQLAVESVDPDKKRAGLVLSDVAGFDHIALTWLGWMKALFVELSGPGVLIAQQGWTPKAPDPNVVKYEVLWT